MGNKQKETGPDTLDNLSKHINLSLTQSKPKRAPPKSPDPIEGVDYWKAPPSAQVQKSKIHPVLLVLLLGTIDRQSPLSILNNQETALLKRIWLEVRPSYFGCFEFIKSKEPFLSRVATFPPPTGININMMPFRLLDKDSLPESCQPYWDMLFNPRVSGTCVTVACMEEADHKIDKLLSLLSPQFPLRDIRLNVNEGQSRGALGRTAVIEFINAKVAEKADLFLASLFEGRTYREDPTMEYHSNDIAYLTIQESFVPAGCTHRRPGLHTDGTLIPVGDPSKKNWEVIGWGSGQCYNTIDGGILIGSNVSSTTRVWKKSVVDPLKTLNPESKYGNLEHLRSLLGEGIKLNENEIWWITDSTPHEGLPVAVDTYRQFVRVVIGQVSVWYNKHSTPNPKGVKPEGARIIYEEKFEGSKNKFTL